jgi:hypothetical protein
LHKPPIIDENSPEALFELPPEIVAPSIADVILEEPPPIVEVLP